MTSIKNKKYMWAAGILIIIVLLIIGSSEWKAHAQAAAEAAANPCAINFLDTFLYNVPATTTPALIGEALLIQYLNAHEHLPSCPSQGIKDYKITAIGAAKNVQGDFTLPISFDLIPATTTATIWATPETHWDGAWIRGKEADLGIQHIITSTSTDATSTYRLVI